jgi:enterochelin esterase-like enzyme
VPAGPPPIGPLTPPHRPPAHPGGQPPARPVGPAAGHAPRHHHPPADHPAAHRPGAIHQVGTLPSGVVRQLRQPAPLESPWLAGTVLGLAVTLIVVWTVLSVRRRRAGRRPRRPLLTRAALAAATALLTLAGAGLVVNSYVGYLPTAAALGHLLRGQPLVSAAPVDAGPVDAGPVDAGPLEAAALAARHPGRTRLSAGPRPVPTAGSQVVRLAIGARGLGVPPSPTYVYLPAGYTGSTLRYPVVYLIHGYPGQSSDWLVAGRAQQAADLLRRDGLTGPMIIVFPTADGGWLHDSECLDATGGGQQLETYLTGTVVSTIDRTFRTIPTRAARAIGGMSSGGYCALNLGLRHLDRYGVILASMPYGDPGRGAERTLLGGDLALVHANSPSWYLPRMAFPLPVAVFLDAGTDDEGTLYTARSLARTLADRGQYVALRLAPGLGHTWREARAELPYALVFAAAQLTRAAPPAPGRGGGY